MQMEMPKPLPQHKKLEMLAGKFSGDEVIQPGPMDPQGGPSFGRTDARIAPGGFYLISDYNQERNGQISYSGHGVYGYDATDDSYVMHWYDSMGMMGGQPIKGKWIDDTLTFQATSPMGHSRYVYEFQKDGSHKFRIDGSQDGQNWMKFMEGHYKRA